MSHNTLLEIIDASGCPSSCPIIPTNLVPGKQYKITGLSQGALGNYSFIAVATSNTTLSNDVTLLPDNVLNVGESWYGQFDYGIWELTWVHDSLNNDVSFSGNISEFKWFDYNVDENIVDTSARLYLGGNTWVGTFSGNRISGRSIVHLNAVATQINKTIARNVWDTKSEVTFSATNGPILYINNTVNNNSELTISDVNDLTLRETTMSNGILHINSVNTIYISNSSILDGALVEFTNSEGEIDLGYSIVQNNCILRASVGNVDVGSSVISGSSIVEFYSTGSISASNINVNNSSSWAFTGDINSNILNILSVNSTITFAFNNGIGQFNFIRTNLFDSIFNIGGTKSGTWLITDSYLIKGRIDELGNNAGNTLDRLVVQDGILTAGYDCTSCYLLGGNSTLVADLTSATKNGYTNPLP